MLFYSVEQSHAIVLTRFGKYVKTATQGIHFKGPFSKFYNVSNWGDIANKKNGRLIELTEQIIDTSPKECHSKDNVPVLIDAAIYWRITDVKKAVFEVDNLPRSLVDTCLNSLRAEIGKITLDEILRTRQELSEKVSSSLLEVSDKWGVQISRVEIQELKTSDETAEAMRMEMAAERKRRANILEAEGFAEAKRKTAEAEAFAIKAKAEAEADYIAKLSKALGGTDNVAKILMLEKALEGYKEISSNPANKVFLPNSIQALLTDDVIQSSKGTK